MKRQTTETGNTAQWTVPDSGVRLFRHLMLLGRRLFVDNVPTSVWLRILQNKCSKLETLIRWKISIFSLLKMWDISLTLSQLWLFYCYNHRTKNAHQRAIFWVLETAENLIWWNFQLSHCHKSYLIVWIVRSQNIFSAIRKYLFLRFWPEVPEELKGFLDIPNINQSTKSWGWKHQCLKKLFLVSLVQNNRLI